MGYRDFAKDYKIEYEERPGRKRPKAVRVYIGPWYRFEQPPEKIRVLRWFYLIGMAAIALLLVIPMCLNCTFSDQLYIAVPVVATWIPWLFAALATWRLWTAKEKVDREHNAMLGARMSGACLFLMGFCLISILGCAYGLVTLSAGALDYVVCGCCFVAGICGIALFSQRKKLNMVMIEKNEN